MVIDLKYFTGTGNSLRILNSCREVFIEEGHSVSISSITDEKPIDTNIDMVGFCFPVYAFGIPRICRYYLKGIRSFSRLQKTFVLITAGSSEETGFAIKDCLQILKKKNCSIVYSEVVQMPINWTTSPIPPYPPSKEEAIEIIEKGIIQAKKAAHDILNGVNKQHVFNVPKRYGVFGLYKEYYVFKYLGIQNMWRAFKIYDSCNSCKLCASVCPTGSITLIDNKPSWKSSCEQCMRCVNFCPQQAIYQKWGGDTIGKNRYLEPNFKPLRHSIKG